jgi:hypothetical protein
MKNIMLTYILLIILKLMACCRGEFYNKQCNIQFTLKLEDVSYNTVLIENN